MRGWFWLLVWALTLWGSPLSQLQEERLDLQRKRSRVQARELATSWIKPIQGSYLYQRGDQFPNQRLERLAITLDQPIFKGFGIWESIRGARARERASLKGVELERHKLLARIYTLVLEIRRLQLLLERADLALKNATIDVSLKREEYRKGEVDATFLNQAILKRNQEALARLDLQEQLIAKQSALRELSDLPPEKISLPPLFLPSKATFLARNLELARLQALYQAKGHQVEVARSRHRPSLSLLYSYNYQKLQGSQFFPDFRYSDHYSTYGVRLQIPLVDIQGRTQVELAQIDRLSQGVALQMKRESLQRLYEQVAKELHLLEKRRQILRADIDLYRSLVEQVKEEWEAKERPRTDLEVMENSLRMRRIDLKLLEIEKQQKLLRLHEGMEGAF
ncbi:MAG: hypothetical protein C6I00_01365 [Nitratiruptor sp.]|nr:hypothetical protein [Nitratiruptor sp.]NPA83246.1 TolC family protein [Campylobacterota bacterium]